MVLPLIQPMHGRRDKTIGPYPGYNDLSLQLIGNIVFVNVNYNLSGGGIT
jgi:hypothetical protein